MFKQVTLLHGSDYVYRICNGVNKYLITLLRARGVQTEEMNDRIIHSWVTTKLSLEHWSRLEIIKRRLGAAILHHFHSDHKGIEEGSVNCSHRTDTFDSRGYWKIGFVDAKIEVSLKSYHDLLSTLRNIQLTEVVWMKEVELRNIEEISALLSVPESEVVSLCIEAKLVLAAN